MAACAARAVLLTKVGLASLQTAVQTKHAMPLSHAQWRLDASFWSRDCRLR